MDETSDAPGAHTQLSFLTSKEPFYTNIVYGKTLFTDFMITQSPFLSFPERLYRILAYMLAFCSYRRRPVPGERSKPTETSHISKMPISP